jgi:hypothetical protein
MTKRTLNNDDVSARPQSGCLNPPSDLGAVLTSMLAALPRVVVTKKLNSTSFRVGKKLFAFTTKRGAVILKVPAETVKVLVESSTAARVVMGKRVMKEWVVIHYKTPTESRKDLGLFRAALEFVSSASRKAY